MTTQPRFERLLTILRLTWDQYFLEVAKVVSLRAACSRRQVGAVIVGPDNRILSTGYNGVPTGELNCSDGGCPRGKLSYTDCPELGSYNNCKGRHAEDNAISYADRPLNGCTIYITRPPCEGCQRLIKGVGIVNVVYG